VMALFCSCRTDRGTNGSRLRPEHQGVTEPSIVLTVVPRDNRGTERACCGALSQSVGAESGVRERRAMQAREPGPAGSPHRHLQPLDQERAGAKDIRLSISVSIAAIGHGMAETPFHL
jgi:hypothetical protein